VGLLIGPSSRMMRFTIPARGRPVKRVSHSKHPVEPVTNTGVFPEETKCVRASVPTQRTRNCHASYPTCQRRPGKGLASAAHKVHCDVLGVGKI
jgi:hypothetical protein